MPLITIDAKIKIKRSTVPGVVPVIGISEDHTDGTWTDNMIYPGEYFFNLPDQKVWLGVEGSVLLIFSAETVYPSLAYADQIFPLGTGERIIKLAGEEDTDALTILTGTDDPLVSFTGENILFYKPLTQQKTSLFQDYVQVNALLQANDLATGGTLTVDSDASFYDFVRMYSDLQVDGGMDVYGWGTFRDRLVANATAAPITMTSLPGAPTTSAIFGYDGTISSTSFRMYMNVGTTAVNAPTTVEIQAAALARLYVNVSGTYTRTNHSLTIAKGAVGHSMLDVNGSFASAYRQITSANTLNINDSVIDCTANTFTVTLPSAVGITGREYTIINSGTGVISISEASGQKINGDGIWYLPFNGAAVTVRSSGADWRVVSCKQRSTLNVVASVAGATFQHNELIGAKSISMTNRNGTISKGDFTFNATTGTITMTVAVSDKITVFYNPQ